jgi:hypothetical protein
MAEEEVASRWDTVRHSLNAGLRLLASEIHEDVPAKDDCGFGHHRTRIGLGEVMVSDPDVAAQESGDLVTARNRREVLPAAHERQTLHLTLRVLRLLSSRERSERDVSGDDVPVVAAPFVEEHRKAVWLLAVAAAGAPDRLRCRAGIAGELVERNELGCVSKE